MPGLAETNCILHNRFGNNAQVDASEIGINGTRANFPAGGAGYDTGKFDNGIKNYNNTNKVTFLNGFSVPNAGIMDFWWKPTYASTSNTRATIIFIGGGSNQVSIEWFNAARKLWIYFYVGGVHRCNYGFNVSFSASELMHIGIEWDALAGAGAKLALYKNAIAQAIGYTGADNTWNLATQSINFNATVGASNCLIDNYKLYNPGVGVMPAVLANKDNEYWPIDYIIPNQFNRISGLKAGRPL